MSQHSESLSNLPAKLYIVATPIGNISDISYRAIETLQQVDVIAAEDTRHSGKLLSHYQIKKPMFPLHDHNERERGKVLIEKIKAGQSVALISDAGTPLISDPGYHLVNECRDNDVDVVPIPGACATIAALSAAGLPTDRFSFEGFLPAKEKGKQDKLNALIEETRTMVFYESPRRIIDTVEQIVNILGGERKLVIARELTKTFESFYALPADEMLAWLKEDSNHCRGEFVLMIAGAVVDTDAIPQVALNTLALLKAQLPLKKAAALTAQIHDQKKNELYKWGLENL
ncbi:16S rRNA (cytidine(1402)-2'-O)-methyltransferase [Psychromonas sp. psych-6C06]|uniref:16S rRNA (cytidine(1402)-2'-O)-methyltransferase n=1 Tax=Psychromonas sp. psych-6C06 TaxID=2058089 RepID=UPI000C3202B4|nr:16S rRNA (cytidine(1402)-2'-O)-methyltransferase [Psychromonas sp. psych-6C06]PKF63420.1 16S rRNA (cytidine(1402)-2'-O)-methyltransferase [Psychromonas sp. psych-6C06]